MFYFYPGLPHMLVLDRRGFKTLPPKCNYKVVSSRKSVSSLPYLVVAQVCEVC